MSDQRIAESFIFAGNEKELTQFVSPHTSVIRVLTTTLEAASC